MKILVVSLVRTFAHLWHGKLYMFQFCTGYIEGVILPWTFHLILPCKMNRLIRRETLLSSWKITKDSTAWTFEGMPKEPFWNPTKKRAGIVVTWWIGAGYRALRTLSVAFLVGFESDGQGFGFWCEFFGTLGPTEPGNTKLKLKNNHHTALIFSTWKTVPNLFFPMVRKSPFLPMQSSRGWARSNVGQDTTREGQELIFYNTLVANAATIWMFLVLGTTWLTIISKI